MAQYDYGTIDPATKTGSALAGDLNSQRDAYHSLHKANTVPAYVTSGMLWLNDTTSTAWKLNFYDGANSLELFSINSVAHTATLSAGLAVANISMSGSIDMTGAEESVTMTDAVGDGVINMDGAGRIDLDAITGHVFKIGGTALLTSTATTLTTGNFVGIRAHTAGDAFYNSSAYSQFGAINMGTYALNGYISHTEHWSSIATYFGIKIESGSSADTIINSRRLGSVKLQSEAVAVGGFSFYGISMFKHTGFSQKLGFVFGPDIPSAPTLNVPKTEGAYHHVTGTTTITDINPTAWNTYTMMFWLEFDGILTLTHGSTLKLPNNTNITTRAGDVGFFMGDGSGGVKLVSWQSALPSTGAGTGDLLANGTIPLTADWNVGSFDITAVDLTATANLTAGGVVTLGAGSLIFPSADGSVDQVLKTDGAGNLGWATIASSGDMILANAQTVTGAKTFNNTKLFLRNVAGTFNGSFVNTNTADRIYTLPDVSASLLYSGGDAGTPSALVGTNVTGLPTSAVDSGTFADARIASSNVTQHIADIKPLETIMVSLGDEDTALTASDTVRKTSIRVPWAFTATDIIATLGTCGTDATVIIDVHLNGTTIMTTDKCDIETGEFSTETATTPPALTTTAFSANDLLEFFVDQIGSTIAGASPTVYILGNRD
jgi:hypothetical protein